MALTQAELDEAQAQINAARDQTHTNIGLAEGWAQIAQDAADASGAESAQTATAEANRAGQQKALAETARTGAETARTGAETAQGLAETARTGAETAQGLAEAAQAGAEEVWGDFQTQAGIEGVAYPEAITYEAIQAALTAAKGTGTRVVAAGEITTDQTLTIECHCDLSRLSIKYTGTGTAVRVGTPTAISYRLSAKVPLARNMNKVDNGWASVAGSVGVELVNLNTCYEVVVPAAVNFEIGLLDLGTNGIGHVYNVVNIGQLENNKRNHVVRSVGTGWANENLYLGGRFSHYSNEGERIPGVKHIEIETADGNQVNNNLWIRPAVEGIANEYAFDCAGVYNMVLSGRWEASDGGARVRWGAKAAYNTILGGYATYRISANPSFSNVIVAPHRFELFGSGNSGGVQFLNSSSAASPSWQILDTIQGGATNADWTWQASAQEIRGRRSTEPHPRVAISALNGQINFGNGQSAPLTRLAQYGSARSFMMSANLLFLQETGIGNIGSLTHPAKELFTLGPIYLNGLYVRKVGGTLEVSEDNTAWKPVVLGDDARLSDARTPTTHQHPLTDLPEVETALDGKVENKGGASGLWIDTTANLPATGEVGVLYVTTG